jgi:superfamily II DNA/RNA helicase
VVIFCLYKKEAEHVHRLLKSTVYRVALLTGDMQQAPSLKALFRLY